MASRPGVVVCVALLATCVAIASAKPFLDGYFWCALLCDDDDVTTAGTTTDDYFDMCTACAPRRTSTSTTAPRPGGVGGQPLTLNLGGVAMNMSLTPQNGTWMISYVPSVAGLSPAGSAPVPVTVAPPGGATTTTTTKAPTTTSTTKKP